MCVYIYMMKPPRSPPPPQWVWVYRSYVPRPPRGWVGGGGVSKVSSSE